METSTKQMPTFVSQCRKRFWQGCIHAITLSSRLGFKGLQPFDSKAHSALGLVFEQEFRDFAAARAHYESAVSADNTNASAHNNLAFLLENHFNDGRAARRHFEIAGRLLAKSLNVDTESNIAKHLGNLVGDGADAADFYDEMRKMCEKSIAANPNNAESHYALAMLLEHYFDEKETAVYHFKRAQELGYTPKE